MQPHSVELLGSVLVQGGGGEACYSILSCFVLHHPLWRCTPSLFWSMSYDSLSALAYAPRTNVEWTNMF